MIKRLTFFFKKYFLFLLLLNTSVVVAQTGNIKGVIKDAQTKEPLPYSNVIIVNRGVGSAADKDGNYIIKNVPVGSYTLRATYVGYKQKEVTVDIKVGRTIEYEFNLEPVTLEGETVTVTAQAEGQYQAINEQLNSSSIKNVVSAARIQELPDANAAESVGRLPGVSLIREGGEGSKVVIRGLSPQYNQITIDGIEMASDVASSNNVVSTDANQQDVTGALLGDRGVDLSMISSNMLGGIEVIKAITPDMDAAVLGGVVNFDMRKAVKESGETSNFIPKFSFLSQGGYNALKNTSNDYKFVGSLEKRFFDNSFGVFFQASTEKRNLSDNELGTTYTLNDKTHGDAGIPDLTNLNLTDVFRIRKRYGGTLVLDYHHSTGDIGLMNFISNSNTNETYRGETAQVQSADEQLHYDITGKETKLNVMSNLLSIKEDIPFFHVDLKLSHSYSETQNPGDANFDFVQRLAGFSGISNNLIRLSPQAIDTYIQHNDSTAFLWSITNSNTLSKERLYQGSLDLQHDFVVSDLISASIKFGGMYQYRKRSYDYNERAGSIRYDGGDAVSNAFSRAFPGLSYATEGLSLQNFVYDGYSYDEFLNGDYKLGYPLNADMMWKLVPIALTTSASITNGGGYKKNNLASLLNDYSGHEVKDAAYIMATVKVGDKISILPGIRYQNLTTTYSAIRGQYTSAAGGIQVPTGTGQQGFEVTKSLSHAYLLPMVHLNYRPNGWFQAHFAYTNTLNYPDYSTITPRYYVGTSFISYNNYELKPTTSENYDLVLSVFTNDIGFLSIDGFIKRIKDLIFYSHGYVTDLSIYPELPQNTHQLYEFTTYINSQFPVDLKGIETDWQTHFWYLPQPFSGLIFNINYSHIFSQADYPKTRYLVTYDELGNATTRIVDTSYNARLLNQPNDILNLAFGYDYRGFSARVSMLYQDNIFKKPDYWFQQRVISTKFTRWDISVKQELPWYGIQLFLNLNNITGANDEDINQKNSFPASEQRYGMSGDLGFRLSF